MEKEERRENRKKLSLEYQVIDGKAYVSGFSGKGNYVEIPYSYESYDVVGFTDSAFEGCQELVTVSFWADIAEISESVFKDCSNLAEISIPGSVSVIHNLYFDTINDIQKMLMD